MEKHRKLIAELNHGLANRLITVIGSARLASIEQRELYLFSPTDYSYSGNINDALAKAIPIIESLPDQVIPSSISSSIGRSIYQPSSARQEIIKGWNHILLHQNDLIALSENFEQSRLHIQDELRQMGRSIIKTKSKTTHYDMGIHIRANSGLRDKNFDWVMPKRDSFIRQISCIVETISAQHLFLTSTDNSYVDFLGDQLSREGLEVTITSKKSSTLSDEPSTAIDDFECLLASRYIVRHPFSTFSALPSFLNGRTEYIYDESGAIMRRNPEFLKGCGL